MTDKDLLISSSPHMLNRLTTRQIMWGVVLSLSPVMVSSIIFFKLLAVKLILTSVASCVAVEAVIQRLRGRKITVSDGSAVLTGLLLAMVLPPSAPLWTVMIGSMVAVGLGKQLFGGLGYNIFNPALLARAFLMAAFPAILTKWTQPFTLHAVTKATPLGLMKFSHAETPYLKLFMGNISGSLGETSAVAILIGAGYLFIKKYADWRIPLGFIATASILATVLYNIDPLVYPDTLFHILSGGMLLGAIFMATDPVTSPVTKKGRWIFGIGCGALAIIIRTWSGLPEGVMYSILLMNGVTPLVNRYTRPRRFGVKR